MGKGVPTFMTVGEDMVSVKPGVRFDCKSLIPSHAAMKEANDLESLQWSSVNNMSLMGGDRILAVFV